MGFQGHNWGLCKMCGRLHDSTERNKKISRALKGRKLSEEIKQKISRSRKEKVTWNKGLTAETDGRVARYVSKWQQNLPEIKRKISEARKGKKLSEETRRKISLSQNGRKLSDKTKLKMRISHLGKKYKPMSKEGRMNISLHHEPGFTGQQWQEWVRAHPESLGKLSNPQLQLYKLTQEFCPNAELEYKVKVENKEFRLDVYIPALSIALEYDGEVWHDPRKDELRDFVLFKRKGITTIRFNKFNFPKDSEELLRTILKG